MTSAASKTRIKHTNIMKLSFIRVAFIRQRFHKTCDPTDENELLLPLPGGHNGLLDVSDHPLHAFLQALACFGRARLHNTSKQFALG
jgi:hypothetical protein